MTLSKYILSFGAPHQRGRSIDIKFFVVTILLDEAHYSMIVMPKKNCDNFVIAVVTSVS